jgi:hypothetical protein
MNETGGQEELRGLDRRNKPMGTLSWMRIDFWIGTCLAGLLAIVSFVVFLETAFVLLVLAIHHRLGDQYSLMLSFSVLAVLAAILYFSCAYLMKIIRRKRRTGNLLLMGEELRAIRKRQRLLGRIFVPALFYYFAIGFTLRAVHFHDFRVSVCAFLLVMWLIAICITALALLRSEPKALVAVISALLCLSGIYFTFHAATSQGDRFHWILFSALMWAMAFAFAVEAIRSPAPKSGIPIAPKESQSMPEA